MEQCNNLQTIDVMDLSNYILCKLGKMSHLKLQKLLYFVQGYHLAYFDGAPLIDDDFQAWTHGPVCRKVFDALKDDSVLYSDVYFEKKLGQSSPIEKLSAVLTSEQIALIDEVLDMYRGESGITLEGMTHSQKPWIDARGGLPFHARCENIISKESMREYFSTLVEV